MKLANGKKRTNVCVFFVFNNCNPLLLSYACTLHDVISQQSIDRLKQLANVRLVVGNRFHRRPVFDNNKKVIINKKNIELFVEC